MDCQKTQSDSAAAVPPILIPQSSIRNPVALPRALLGERIVEACLAAGCAAVLLLGMILVPSPDGLGTHTELGLPPCGMWLYYHKPCPTCGVTTSFTLAAHGQFVQSAVTQPFGLVFFLATVAGLALNAWTAVAGRTWFGLVTVRRATIVIIAGVIILLASWAYKWSTV
jgi:hypothetical protein